MQAIGAQLRAKISMNSFSLFETLYILLSKPKPMTSLFFEESYP